MFESAVCKIQDGLEIKLTANERDSVKSLRNTSDGHDKDESEAFVSVLTNCLAKLLYRYFIHSEISCGN